MSLDSNAEREAFEAAILADPDFRATDLLYNKARECYHLDGMRFIYRGWQLARSQPSEWVAKVPVEAIEYALATMDLELDYLCTQYSQRPEESGERETWKRRVALCKSHIESLRALLPSLPEPLMPKE